MRKTTMILAALLLSATAAAAPLSDLASGEPESWAAVDAERCNELIEAAVATGAAWPRSPLETVVRLTHSDVDTRELVVWEVKNHGEGADAARIVCIRDGLLDDSIRGIWHRFDLERRPDGTWRVAGAVVAYRCWRSDDPEAFGDFSCP